MTDHDQTPASVTATARARGSDAFRLSELLTYQRDTYGLVLEVQAAGNGDGHSLAVKPDPTGGRSAFLILITRVGGTPVAILGDHEAQATDSITLGEPGLDLDHPEVADTAALVISAAYATHRIDRHDLADLIMETETAATLAVLEDVKRTYRRALVTAAGVAVKLAEHRATRGSDDELDEAMSIRHDLAAEDVRTIVTDDARRYALGQALTRAKAEAVRLAAFLADWGVSPTLGAMPEPTDPIDPQAEVDQLVDWLAGGELHDPEAGE